MFASKLLTYVVVFHTHKHEAGTLLAPGQTQKLGDRELYGLLKGACGQMVLVECGSRGKAAVVGSNPSPARY